MQRGREGGRDGGWVGEWLVVAAVAGTGREEGSETGGREVSRDGEGERRVGENGLQHGGCSRERGCGRTDLLPGSHVPPARETGEEAGVQGRETGTGLTEEENEEEQ